MKKRQYFSGSGRTKKGFFIDGSDEGETPPNSNFIGIKPHFHNNKNLFEQIRAHCQEVLRSHNMPDTLRPVAWLEKEKWRDLPEDIVEEMNDTDIFVSAFAYMAAKSFCEREGIGSDDEQLRNVCEATKYDKYLMSDSQAGYAARLLQDMSSIEERFKVISDTCGDSKELRHLIFELFELGALTKEAELKYQWGSAPGKRAGMAKKSKVWAVELAKSLNMQISKDTSLKFNDVWKGIPEGEGGYESYAGFEVYRQGDLLKASSYEYGDDEIKKESFRTGYMTKKKR